MRTLFILVSIFFVIGEVSIAQQKNFSVGIGPTVGLPMNKYFKYDYHNAIGGSLNIYYQVTKLGYISAGLTYISSSAKNNSYKNTRVTFLKFGYKTNLTNTHFFLMADAGLSAYQLVSSSAKNFTIGGGIGYSFEINRQNSIDIFPTYNYVIPNLVNSTWLLLNVGYRYNFKRG